MKIDKNIVNSLVNIALSFFAKKAAEPATVPSVNKTEPPVVSVNTADLGPLWHQVDWNNPKAKLSKYFTVGEALMLREWKRMANEKDGLNDKVKENLYNIFQKMDEIRELLGKPCFVRSAYRPSDYNVAIGGAKRSAHMADEEYAAVDFWTDQDGDGDKDGKDCDDIKAILMPKLEAMGLRMEDNGAGARWVHVDNRKPGPGGRFFKP